MLIVNLRILLILITLFIISPLEAALIFEPENSETPSDFYEGFVFVDSLDLKSDYKNCSFIIPANKVHDELSGISNQRLGREEGSYGKNYSAIQFSFLVYDESTRTQSHHLSKFNNIFFPSSDRAHPFTKTTNKNEKKDLPGYPKKLANTQEIIGYFNSLFSSLSAQEDSCIGKNAFKEKLFEDNFNEISKDIGEGVKENVDVLIRTKNLIVEFIQKHYDSEAKIIRALKQEFEVLPLYFDYGLINLAKDIITRLGYLDPSILQNLEQELNQEESKASDIAKSMQVSNLNHHSIESLVSKIVSLRETIRDIKEKKDNYQIQSLTLFLEEQTKTLNFLLNANNNPYLTKLKNLVEIAKNSQISDEQLTNARKYFDEILEKKLKFQSIVSPNFLNFISQLCTNNSYIIGIFLHIHNSYDSCNFCSTSLTRLLEVPESFIKKLQSICMASKIKSLGNRPYSDIPVPFFRITSSCNTIRDNQSHDRKFFKIRNSKEPLLPADPQNSMVAFREEKPKYIYFFSKRISKDNPEVPQELLLKLKNQS